MALQNGIAELNSTDYFFLWTSSNLRIEFSRAETRLIVSSSILPLVSVGNGVPSLWLFSSNGGHYLIGLFLYQLQI